jgi:hypothetical protein
MPTPGSRCVFVPDDYQNGARAVTLRVAAAADQASALQHLEVLGDGGLAHRERFGELRYRSLSGRQTREDGSASRVGEGGERGIKPV